MGLSTAGAPYTTRREGSSTHLSSSLFLTLTLPNLSQPFLTLLFLRPRGAPVPLRGPRSVTGYDEACGSCGNRSVVSKELVDAFAASTAPAASTGPRRAARARRISTTHAPSSADLAGAPMGPGVLNAWGGSAPCQGRSWYTSSGESRHERQYRDEDAPRTADSHGRHSR
jgi:hypothetical protein